MGKWHIHGNVDGQDSEWWENWTGNKEQVFLIKNFFPSTKLR